MLGKDVAFAGPELERQHRQPACIAAGGGEGGLACPGRRLHLQRRASRRRCQARGGGKSGRACAAEHHVAGGAAAQHGRERGDLFAEAARQHGVAIGERRGVAPRGGVAAEQRPQLGGNRQAAGGHRPLAHDLEDPRPHEAVVGQREGRERSAEQGRARGGEEMKAGAERTGRLQLGERQVEQVARLVLAAQRHGEPLVQLQLQVGKQAPEGAVQLRRGLRECDAGGSPVLRRGTEQGGEVFAPLARRKRLEDRGRGADAEAGELGDAGMDEGARQARALACRGGFRAQAGGGVHGEDPPRSAASLRS